ncbi:MAG: bacterial transcriptional activator domain-containing protein [candidate division Zixibacteria bacterium]|nr:bacterial transcriptional activator domain-containing protein [candidate division Zixibacteria bacterium]
MQVALSHKWPALSKAAANLYKLAETTKSRAWKVTASFLTAMGADGSGRHETAKQFLRTGLRELRFLGWSSYPMANDTVSSFVIVKSVRYGLIGDSFHLLLKDDHLMDLAPAFNSELGLKDLTPTELRNLLVSAADLQVRGLVGMAKHFVEHKSKIVAIAAQRYLDIISTIPLPPLYVRMFGGFSVIAGGRNVSFSRKKSRLLLQLLLVESCGPTHEEVILESLWPNSDPIKSKPILQTCVKDLRRALDPYHDPKGKSYIIYSNEHYSLDLPKGSTVDTIEFEDLLKKSGFDDTAIVIQSQDQESILRSAAALYRGELLPEGRFETYAVEYRERLLQRFLEISVALARFSMDKGKTSEAIVVLERGLQLDPLWGEGVREMMAARVRNGEFYRAFQTYRAYEKRLQLELAVSPDQSLTAYFDELVASIASS